VCVYTYIYICTGIHIYILLLMEKIRIYVYGAVIVSVTFRKLPASNTSNTFALIKVVWSSVTFQGLGNFPCYLHELKVNPHHDTRDVVKMEVNLMS
jgi:hypothetical protein